MRHGIVQIITIIIFNLTFHLLNYYYLMGITKWCCIWNSKTITSCSNNVIYIVQFQQPDAIKLITCTIMFISFFLCLMYSTGVDCGTGAAVKNIFNMKLHLEFKILIRSFCSISKTKETWGMRQSQKWSKNRMRFFI